jgi:phosphoribosyl-ATP pyrophosphohydrolase/phosphoribosyl-AMP cyclohydrolase
MNLDFDKGNGLIPAIVQDAATHKVLMLGYMNAEALAETRRQGKVTFYSRSKGRLWTKGETSGNFLHLREILMDCDGDTLLIKAVPAGPVCHLGTATCFAEETSKGFMYHLEDVIASRKEKPAEGSYTSSLFAKGIKAIAQKVGEEATELIIEAMDDDRERLLNEAADLVYHLIVLLREKGVTFEGVEEVLSSRNA